MNLTVADYARARRNIHVILAWSVLSSLGASITSGALLSLYITSSLVSGTDESVGGVASAAGAAMLLAALPAGALTDRCGRRLAARAGAVAGVLAAAALAAALALGGLPLLYAASALGGAAAALSAAPVAALLADSLPAGGRTRVMTIQYVANLAASAGGPLGAMVVFLLCGNAYDGGLIAIILHAGNAIAVAAAMLLLLLDDAGGGASESLLKQQSGGGGAVNSIAMAATEADAVAESELGAQLLPEGAGVAGVGGGVGGGGRNLGHQTLRLLGVTLTVRAVPYVIFFSDLVLACGAGMTVQFFSLFFRDDLALSPAAVAGVFAAAPVAIAALSLLALPLNRLLGRALACVLLTACGTAALFALTRAMPAPAAIVLYLVRTASMNASYPTQRAILMDVVAANTRGCWSALENLTAATWTGSAALGGMLLQQLGYSTLFVITGTIYVASLLMLLPLVPLTAGERVDGGGGSWTAAASKDEGDEGGELVEKVAGLDGGGPAAGVAQPPLRGELDDTSGA